MIKIYIRANNYITDKNIWSIIMMINKHLFEANIIQVTMTYFKEANKLSILNTLSILFGKILTYDHVT